MADNEKKPTGVPMIGTDGQAYMIPFDQVGEAVLHGGKVAVRMGAPGGSEYWVPADQAEEGMRQGGWLVQNDGSPYPEGQQPVIVGHNATGQPIWGSKTGEEKLNGEDLSQPPMQRALSSAMDVMKSAATGLFDANPTPEEQREGLTTGYDFFMRPVERAVGAQMQQGEEAADLMKNGDYARGMAHGIASILPLIGPWTAEATEEYYKKLGQGDIAGAIGTLGGNAAVAAAMEEAPKVAKAGVDLAKSVPGRIAEMQAPAEGLDTAPAPGEMTPRQRWEAANGMGVNLDRAQATQAPVPAMAKRVTEKSLLGNPKFERNNAGNVRALHGHAQGLLNEAAPDGMGREEFGQAAQDALREHKAGLVDEPGMREEAADLLNGIDRHDMDGQQFGAAAQEALQKHHDGMYTKAKDFLTRALQRKGASIGTGSVEAAAGKIFEDNDGHYKEFPEGLKLPGVKLAWDWVNRFKPRVGPDGVPVAPRALPPADVAKLRSELWNLYQSPDTVGTPAEGWLKQLVASLDDSLTDPANEKGMTPAEIQKFRAGTSLWKRMKSMYDDPQSPFFSILRSLEPKTAAATLEKLKPTAAQQFREAMNDAGRPDLVRQQQRQIVGHLLDPAENGTADLDGLAARFEKMPKEQARELLDAQHLNALGSLAKRTQTATPYDAPGSHLAQVINAPDGMAAARAIFSDNGTLRLTPEEVRQVGEAAPELLPQMRRQAMERMLDPAGNGTPDLRNFASRWQRTQAPPIHELLGDDGVKKLDDLAEVARTVNLPSNPSQTATVLQPAEEAGDLLKTAGKLGTEVVAGAGTGALLSHANPVAEIAGAAAPVVATAARGAIASRLLNPDATAAIMEHEKPPTVAETVKQAAATPGLPGAVADAARTPGMAGAADVAGAVAARPAQAAAAGAAASHANPSAADRFKQMSQQREGVSTPPNEGQVTSTTTAEPNEVHDPVKEAAAMREAQAASAASAPAAVAGEPVAETAPKQPAQPNDVMVRTGASSSGTPGPQASYHPDTHEFSRSQFSQQNPDEDAEEAERQAQAAGYAVVA